MKRTWDTSAKKEFKTLAAAHQQQLISRQQLENEEEEESDNLEEVAEPRHN